MTVILLAFLLLAAVLFTLLSPFWAPSRSAQEQEDSRLTDLYARKVVLYDTIKELEADYQLGKVSSEDYSRISSQLKIEAVTVLRQIDYYQRAGLPLAIDQEIEAAIRARRARFQQAASTPRFCPQCGAPLQPGDRFCGQCGAPVLVSDRNNPTGIAPMGK